MNRECRNCLHMRLPHRPDLGGVCARHSYPGEGPLHVALKGPACVDFLTYVEDDAKLAAYKDEMVFTVGKHWLDKVDSALKHCESLTNRLSKLEERFDDYRRLV